MKNLAWKLIDATLQKFWCAHRSIVQKNRQFKDIHSGETCFIFGNGASLKYYDISKLPKNPAIVCAYSLVDKRMHDLNIKYYVFNESYSLYPFVFNTYPHIRKFQRNKILNIFAESLKKYKNVEVITNLTNFYSTVLPRSRTNYIYHFGRRNVLSCDMSDSFGACAGALDYMLGIAKYMGFSKAIILGCDYLGSPPQMGHFYYDSDPFWGDYNEEYCKRVKKVVNHLEIDVLAILPEGSHSPDFEFDTYENHFGLERYCRENYEFIDPYFLSFMRSASKSDQILM